MRHHAVLSCLLVALLALAGAASILAPAARGDTGGTKVKAPTLLWKLYPLELKPKGNCAGPADSCSQPAADERPDPGVRAAVIELDSHQTPVWSPILVVLAFVTLFGVGGALVVRLGLARVNVGEFRRGRQPPIQAAGKDDGAVAGAEARDAELDPEPALDAQLRQLIERVQRAPQSERAELAQKIEVLHELIAAGSTQAAPSLKAQPPASPRRHAQQTGVARCEIGLWRGFGKCQLYAALDGSEEAFVHSRNFRLPVEAEPTARAEEALSELVARLEQDGWTVVSEGLRWYQRRLERPGYGEPG